MTSCHRETDLPEPGYDYANSYLPLKTGNTWTYIHNNNVQDTVITKVEGDSFSQGFQAFYTVVNSGEGGMYYSQEGDLYYTIVYTDLGPGFISPILDASAYEGYSVTTKDSIAYSNDPTPRLSTMTILGTNISKTINGKTYKNVIHTSVDVEEAFNGYYMNIQTYDFYFSPGIGLIEIDKSNAGYIYDILTIVSYKVD